MEMTSQFLRQRHVFSWHSCAGGLTAFTMFLLTILGTDYLWFNEPAVRNSDQFKL